MSVKDLMNKSRDITEYHEEIWLEKTDGDLEKAQYINTQLKEIMESEEKKLHSNKNRVTFFLGTIIASFTLVLTILAPQSSSFAEWSSGQQILFIIVVVILLSAVVFYLRIYYQTNNTEALTGTPLNEDDAFLFVKNQSKMEEILQISSSRYYIQIGQVKTQRKRTEKLFKFGDGAFFIGVLFCLIYAVVMTPFSPATILFFILTVIAGYYLLFAYVIAKEISTIGKSRRKKD